MILIYWFYIALHCKIVLSGQLSLECDLVLCCSIPWDVTIKLCHDRWLSNCGWMLLACMLIQDSGCYGWMWKCFEQGWVAYALSFHSAIDWFQITESNISLCATGFKVTFESGLLRSCVKRHLDFLFLYLSVLGLLSVPCCGGCFSVYASDHWKVILTRTCTHTHTHTELLRCR